MRIIIAMAAVLLISEVFGCTGLKVVADSGEVVHGRTVEFAAPVEFSVAVIPRGYSFQGTTPLGKGLSFQAKYAAVGMMAFDDPSIMDGMNEKGLSVGTFYFPDFAGYTETTQENQSRGLSSVEFSNWILTQFATLDEVKQALPGVVITTTVSPSWGPQAAPFHYIVYDKTGKALVIEPIDGKLLVYDNPVGTFTNSPDFPWHMTNLRNWINMSAYNSEPVKLMGKELKPMGQGSGMVGILGDFTATSRFVRAAFYSGTVFPPKTADEGIGLVFHMLNQFDIPKGSVREKAGGKIYPDFTQVTVARNPNSLKYYFRTYDNVQIKVVDLSKFDLNAKAIVTYKDKGNEQALDVTDRFK